MDTAYSSLIEEDLDELRAREREARHRGGAERFQLLRLLKAERVSTVTEAAAILGYHVPTVQHWWQCYRKGGLSALLPSQEHRGARERITPEAWNGLRDAGRPHRWMARGASLSAGSLEDRLWD